ncbi:MAG: ATP synthase F1 subunit epsilon, partial [Patescibacteria group bacterium]
MKTLSLKIVTPERVVYEDTVDSVTATTEMGEVTILP